MLHSISKVAGRLNVDGITNRVVERFFHRKFQILGYHKVSPEAHPFFQPVHPDVFERQMNFLGRHYNVLCLSELVDRAKRGDVPERAVAITFDDGYSDNYEYAFPILKKHRFPATIFVATGAIGTGELIWHDRVFDAFRFATVDRAQLADAAVPELLLDTIDARRQSLQATLLRAKRLYGEVRRNFVEDVESKLCPRLPSATHQRMLNWAQVREMHAGSIEFGSHTVTHTILSRIPRSEIIKELQDSRDELADRIGSPVALFAYPNGQTADFNEEVKGIVRECGYSCAVTCCCGSNDGGTDLFELKRGLPWQSEIDVFRFKFFLQRHGLAS